MTNAASRGQSSIEYLLVVGVFALAFSLGSDGPVRQLLDAMDAYLRHYTFTLSRP